MKSVGDIRRYLKKKNISPEVLAKEIGLSHMTIRRWLKHPDRFLIPSKYRPLFQATIEKNGTSLSFPTAMATGSPQSDGFLKEIISDMENRGRSISAPELEKLEAQLQEKKKSTTLSSDFMKILKSVTKAALAPGKGKLKFACIGALVYFINPIDLVPDYLGPIGLVDDFAVLSWVATLILPSQVAKLKRSKTTVDES